jgi:hypothetical protein
MGSHLYRLLKNSSGGLRRAQDKRGGLDIIDDFPFMLRLSKHSERFSTACLLLTFHLTPERFYSPRCSFSPSSPVLEDAKSVFYYRIHSPVVLIEFDHQRPFALRGIGSQPTRQHIQQLRIIRWNFTKFYDLRKTARSSSWGNGAQPFGYPAKIASRPLTGNPFLRRRTTDKSDSQFLEDRQQQLDRSVQGLDYAGIRASELPAQHQQ